MGADLDLFFGTIALQRNYCTQDQIDKAVSLQSEGKDRVPLGQILLSEGFITQEQHSEILAIQRINLSAIDPVHKASKESILLGKLALRDRLMTEEQVNACLQIQARATEKRTLGEIMIQKGYLTPKQLKSLLAKQSKKIMSCATCKLSFTVFTISPGKAVLCPRCRTPLGEGKPTESVTTDAHLDTTMVRLVRQENTPPPPPAQAKDKAKGDTSIRMVRMKCPMCEKPFQEPVDSKGRVDCPFCHSSFSA